MSTRSEPAPAPTPVPAAWEASASERDGGPLTRLVRLAARAVGAPAALLVLPEEGEEVEAEVAPARAAGAEAREPAWGAGRGLAARVVADGPRGTPVAAPGVGLGVALARDGRAVGALCALDVRPRQWTDAEAAALAEAGTTLLEALALRERAAASALGRQRVESVLASISDAFFTLDRRWRFAFVNDRAEEVLQRARPSLLGRVLWDEFPAALGSAFEREYRRAMATGEPVAFDAYYPAPLEAWYEVRAYPGPEGLAVYFQDVSERRRAAAAVAESEARWRAVQDASTDGSALLRAQRDADGAIVDLRFTYANAAAEAIVGAGPLVGRTLCADFPATVEQGRLAVYRRVIETGEPWLGEIQHVGGAGVRGLRVTAVKVEDGVHLAIADLSERIRAAEERERLLTALQEERAVRDAVTAQMPAGLVVVEAPAGRLTLWNRETERLLGHPMVPVDDVGEYGRYGGEHPDGRPYAPEEYPVARALRGELVDQHALDYRRPDGALARLSANAVPVRDASGTVTHAVCTLVDVTAREAAAERTRQLQAVSAALAAAATPTEVTELFVAHAVAALGAFGGSMALVDADGAHATFAHAIGYAEDEVARWRTFPLALATPFGDAIRGRAVVHVEGMDGWRARYPELVASAALLQNVTLVSLPLLVGDRAVGVVGLGFRHARALPPEERMYLQTLAGVAAQALDRARAYERAHRSRAEAEEARARAEAARRDAEQANASKAEFLATMSHELRTPLNAIGGYTQLIEMGVHGPVTPAQRQALDRVQRSQQHLLGLINAVLNYAKLEAGHVEYAFETVAPGALAREVEALVAPQAAAKRIALAVRDDGAPEVRADPEKGLQVLLNLLSNAVKFTGEGGRVTVTCAAHGDDAAAIEVRDTGRGIAAHQLGRVFDPFVQVGRRLTSGDQGTGLGLAISRDLARGMGGDLTAESEEHVGSAFRFVLPRALPRAD